MTNFLKRLFWLILALVLIAFSIENRTTVFVTVPLTEITVSLPVYVIFFMGLFVGLSLAAAALSWTRLKGFVARRQAEREATHLRTRLKVQDEEESQTSAAEKYQMVEQAAKE